MYVIDSDKVAGFNNEVDKYYSHQSFFLTDFFRTFEKWFLVLEKHSVFDKVLFDDLDLNFYKPISPFWNDFQSSFFDSEDDESISGFINGCVIVPVLEKKNFLHAEIFMLDCWPADDRYDNYSFWIDTKNCQFWGKSKKMIGGDYFFVRRRISRELCSVLDNILSEKWDNIKDQKFDCESSKKTWYEKTLEDGYFFF